MTDIPDDVMKAAVVAFNTATDAIPDEECYRIIARAIMAERERWLAPFKARDGANAMETARAVETLAEWFFTQSAMFGYDTSSFADAVEQARDFIEGAAAIRKGQP